MSEKFPIYENKEPQQVNYLMTYEEYLKREHDIPYIYEISNGHQKLLYFGAEHTFDPADEQLDAIRQKWEEFISSVDKKQAIVFVEGGKRDVEETEQEARKGGEPHFATYLAKESKVTVESPEPPFEYEVEELLKEFSREEIFYYYFARLVAQWHRLLDKPSFENYVGGLLKKSEARPASERVFPYNLDDAKRIHKEIFGTEFDENDIDHFMNAEDPTVLNSVSNRVARACSQIRDNHILEQIRQQWEAGKSLFVVYGATHAVMQEPAIRAFRSIS